MAIHASPPCSITAIPFSVTLLTPPLLSLSLILPSSFTAFYHRPPTISLPLFPYFCTPSAYFNVLLPSRACHSPHRLTILLSHFNKSQTHHTLRIRLATHHRTSQRYRCDSTIINHCSAIQSHREEEASLTCYHHSCLIFYSLKTSLQLRFPCYASLTLPSEFRSCQFGIRKVIDTDFGHQTTRLRSSSTSYTPAILVLHYFVGGSDHPQL